MARLAFINVHQKLMALTSGHCSVVIEAQGF
jgi:hypothetical protein